MKRTIYYTHAGEPSAYAYDWRGLPAVGTRAAETRGMGDHIDISALVNYRKDLGAYEDVYQGTSMSMLTGARSRLHTGMEPLAGLSDNEKKWLMIAGAAAAAFFIYKKAMKK